LETRRINYLADVVASSLSAILLHVLVFVLGISEGRAIPLQARQASLVVPVASGCGLGVHRGPLDGCYPLYFSGYFGSDRNNYYTGFNGRGVCYGRGAHLACNQYGICWIACN